MFSLIQRFYSLVLGFITGSWESAITNVVGFIRDMFHAQHTYWHTISGHVINAWARYARANLMEREGISLFMDAQYHHDVHISKAVIPWLIRWITWLGGNLTRKLQKAVIVLQRQMAAGDAKQHAYTRSVLIWVIVHVLKFLFGFITKILGWIARVGDTMWHYFTHLDEFAMLLFWHIITSLEKLAWDAAKRLGTFFLALMVHHIVRFATLVESVIDAVL